MNEVLTDTDNLATVVLNDREDIAGKPNSGTLIPKIKSIFHHHFIFLELKEVSDALMLKIRM